MSRDEKGGGGPRWPPPARGPVALRGIASLSAECAMSLCVADVEVVIQQTQESEVGVETIGHAAAAPLWCLIRSE